MSIEYTTEGFQSKMGPAFAATKKAEAGPRWDPQAELPDLTGKVAIVTGANDPNALGYRVAIQLALKGARVYLTARTEEKSTGAVAEMQKDAGSQKLDLQTLVLELSSFESVKAAAQTILAKETRLDILVDNAGGGDINVKRYGVAEPMVVNYLAPFLFTTELLPLIKKTSGARVVIVSSLGACLPPNGVQLSSIADLNQDMGDSDTLMGFMNRFGLSKLANILFANELQRRFDAEGVSALALSAHPGATNTTGAIRKLKAAPDLKGGNITPAEGALAPLFAAAHPRVTEERDLYAGAFLIPYGQVFEKNKNMKNAELAQDLWRVSEEVVGKYRA